MRTISLAADSVGPDLLPLEELADCAEAALRRDGRTLLSYGPGAGYGPLRELIGEWFAVHPSRVVLTNGQLHGLALLARRLAARRTVITEYPIHDRAEKVLLEAGAMLQGVPVDERGIVVEELQNTLQQYVQPAMVYLSPSFHNPTGWSTPEARRAEIVDLVIQQNMLQTQPILLLEDGTYGLTRFEGEPVPSLFDLSQGRSAFSSSFSATVAPGLRVGFFVLPERVAEQLAEVATDTYITPSLLAQATVFEFLGRGGFERHLERLRQGLRERRDAMLAALERYLPEATWSRPAGGLFLWVQLPGHRDGRAVLARARGVSAVDGTRFGAVASAIRLSYGFASPEEIDAGVERLAEAVYDRAA